MPILELPVQLLGRRVRPVALGLTLWGTAVLWAMLGDRTLTGPEHVTLVVVLVSIGAFVAGWVLDSTRWERVGLLGTVFAATSNVALVLLTIGWQPRVLTSLGALVIGAGAYWLEALDPRSWLP